MRIYIDLIGFSLNIDLSKKAPPATTTAEQPPTQLATPMRVTGFAHRSAGLSDAAYDTSKVDPR